MMLIKIPRHTVTHDVIHVSQGNAGGKQISGISG